MHKLLQRQMDKIFGAHTTSDRRLEALLGLVSETYGHFDEDRALLERSLEISSRELVAVNKDLRQKLAEIQQVVAHDTALFESGGEGILVLDEAGYVRRLNKVGGEILRCLPADAIGKHWEQVIPLERESGVLLPSQDHPIFAGMQESRTVRDSRYVYRLSTKQVVPLAITAAPVAWSGGIAEAIVIFHDISEERRVDRAKTEFVSLASHQLRTPLTAVNWYTEMLLSGDAGPLTDRQHEFLQAIQQSTQREVELVRALLNVSRIELGVFSVTPVPTNVCEAIDEILDEFAPSIQIKGLTMSRVYCEGIPAIQVDPNLFRIIIQNLVSNAIKYTNAGGSIHVKIEKIPGDGYRVSVADTGCGIPATQQSRIFTKLFRTDNAAQHDTDGSGLGLYLVKSIVEHVGGRIWFSSVENVGSTFFVSIPESGMVPRAGVKMLDPTKVQSYTSLATP